jgi:hypothetical protein
VLQILVAKRFFTQGAFFARFDHEYRKFTFTFRRPKRGTKMALLITG